MADLRANKNIDSEHEAFAALLRLNETGVLEFSGKKYAVNLLWLAIDEISTPSSALKAQNKSRLERIRPDFIGERSNIISQYAYGHLVKGHRLGMPAAASIITDILVGEWHGCFKADNGWWYIAVHADAIAPDGDRFFTTEEAAYNHFKLAHESHNWPRAYAPEAWSIPNTSDEITLRNIFANGISSTYLKPVTIQAIFGNTKNAISFIVGLGFFLLVVLAFLTTGLNQYFGAIQPVKRSVLLNVTDPIIIPPRFYAGNEATKLLEISDYAAPQLIGVCLLSFEDIFVTLPGWSLIEISCKDGAVIATWQRTKARLADLNTLRTLFPAESSMLYDGQGKIQVSTPLDLTKLTKVTMQVKNKEYLYALITSRLETKGDLSISQIESAPAEQAIDPVTGQVLPAAAPEKFLSVEFSSPIAAYEWLEDFDIQGMRPLELNWSVKDSKWRLSGLVQYQ